MTVTAVSAVSTALSPPSPGSTSRRRRGLTVDRGHSGVFAGASSVRRVWAKAKGAHQWPTNL